MAGKPTKPPRPVPGWVPGVVAGALLGWVLFVRPAQNLDLDGRSGGADGLAIIAYLLVAGGLLVAVAAASVAKGAGTALTAAALYAALVVRDKSVEDHLAVPLIGVAVAGLAVVAVAVAFGGGRPVRLSIAAGVLAGVATAVNLVTLADSGRYPLAPESVGGGVVTAAVVLALATGLAVLLPHLVAVVAPLVAFGLAMAAIVADAQGDPGVAAPMLVFAAGLAVTAAMAIAIARRPRRGGRPPTRREVARDLLRDRLNA